MFITRHTAYESPVINKEHRSYEVEVSQASLKDKAETNLQ